MKQLLYPGVAMLLSAVTVFSGQHTSWRGPARDGRYPDTGLMRVWPAKGPPMVWSIDGLGRGYSSPSFANGKIYLTGTLGQTGHVFILSRDGTLWRSYEYGPEFTRSYPGSRSTPLIVDDLLYLSTGMGKIVCLRADTGELVWSRDALADFGGSNITWGMTENLLIDGDKVFYAPGGTQHNVVALARWTGEVIWSSPGTGKGDLSAYCSPLLVPVGGRNLFVTHMARHMVGLDADTGGVLWSHPFTNRHSIHSNTPLFKDGHLYAFSTDESGSMKLRLNADGSRIGLVWENKEINPMHGGAVIVDDHIYAAVYVGRRWYCMDRNTGRATWSSRAIDRGIVIYADGMLYCYTERGELALVKPNPARFEIISQTRITIGTGEHFAHPVIHEGGLYVRRGDAMILFAIRDR